MSGKIISIVNRKGGVAKTTLTLGLADTFCCALNQPYHPEMKRVVVVDLDPQGSLTRALLHDRLALENDDPLMKVLKARRTLSGFLERKFATQHEDITKYLTHGIGPVGADYSMLANDSLAWDVERKAIKEPGEEDFKDWLKDALRTLAAAYQYVLVDCPPGQTVLAEACIECSSLVLCPITPDYFTFWGLTSFERYISDRFETIEHVSRPPARYIFTKFREKAPSYDPQDEIFEKVWKFFEEGRYIVLMREAATDSILSSKSRVLPHDPRIGVRLLGAPTTNVVWKWEKIYTNKTREKLIRLALAVQKELEKNG